MNPSKITTSPKAQIAGEILRFLECVYTPTEAQHWMLSAQPEFGGRSAIELIREGRDKEVRAAIVGIAKSTRHKSPYHVSQHDKDSGKSGRTR